MSVLSQVTGSLSFFRTSFLFSKPAGIPRSAPSGEEGIGLSNIQRPPGLLATLPSSQKNLFWVFLWLQSWMGLPWFLASWKRKILLLRPPRFTRTDLESFYTGHGILTLQTLAVCCPPPAQSPPGAPCLLQGPGKVLR